MTRVFIGLLAISTMLVPASSASARTCRRARPDIDFGVTAAAQDTLSAAASFVVFQETASCGATCHDSASTRIDVEPGEDLLVSMHKLSGPDLVVWERK